MREQRLDALRKLSDKDLRAAYTEHAARVERRTCPYANPPRDALLVSVEILRMATIEGSMTPHARS